MAAGEVARSAAEPYKPAAPPLAVAASRSLSGGPSGKTLVRDLPSAASDDSGTDPL
eukprot:CAMPEP_0180809672 /NCGR_PEP_ID=MMETSP1038_2-20121128/64448_1 /TAXON_ID=632150 /ORGANISM="Azadinium spinosum, Strain 3D9" /LENGTH=55 /DNA_ID=CAMNT_0022850855 /DNA_START=13 /DNA_END=176 /DNA_ORIENTATION=-